MEIPKVVLAPLSGFADLPFRLIAREFGARLCSFEMLSATAMMYNSRGNKLLLKTVPEDAPIAAQLVGSDPSVIADAAQKLLGLVSVTHVELNSACPAKKVIKKKGGAYLLSAPRTLEKILKRLVSAVPVPVTVKIRAGFRRSDPGASADIARLCESAGCSAIFIHGRTAQQRYSGDVDYPSIRAVKEAVGIPVVGSGNILTPPLARRMFDETGCDGVLAARGSMGNPWIFRDIEDYLRDGATHAPASLEEKKKVLKRHLGYINKYQETPLSTTIGIMARIAMSYLKGLSKACRLRDRICRARSYESLLAIIDEA